MKGKGPPSYPLHAAPHIIRTSHIPNHRGGTKTAGSWLVQGHLPAPLQSSKKNLPFLLRGKGWGWGKGWGGAGGGAGFFFCFVGPRSQGRGFLGFWSVETTKSGGLCVEWHTGNFRFGPAYTMKWAARKTCAGWFLEGGIVPGGDSGCCGSV